MQLSNNKKQNVVVINYSPNPLKYRHIIHPNSKNANEILLTTAASVTIPKYYGSSSMVARSMYNNPNNNNDHMVRFALSQGLSSKVSPKRRRHKIFEPRNFRITEDTHKSAKSAMLEKHSSKSILKNHIKKHRLFPENTTRKRSTTLLTGTNPRRTHHIFTKHQDLSSYHNQNDDRSSEKSEKSHHYEYHESPKKNLNVQKEIQVKQIIKQQKKSQKEQSSSLLPMLPSKIQHPFPKRNQNQNQIRQSQLDLDDIFSAKSVKIHYEKPPSLQLKHHTTKHQSLKQQVNAPNNILVANSFDSKLTTTAIPSQQQSLFLNNLIITITILCSFFLMLYQLIK